MWAKPRLSDLHVKFSKLSARRNVITPNLCICLSILLQYNNNNHHHRRQSCSRQVAWSSHRDVSAVSRLSEEQSIIHSSLKRFTKQYVKSSFEAINCSRWHQLFWQAIPQVDHSYSKEIRSYRFFSASDYDPLLPFHMLYDAVEGPYYLRHKSHVDTYTYTLQWHHLCFCDTRALADPVSLASACPRSWATTRTKRILLTNTEMANLLCCYSNCCVNPIIYCFVNDSFQRNLLRTLRCRCLAPHPGGAGVGGGRPATPVSVARLRRGRGGGETEMRAVNGGGGGVSPDTTALTALSLRTAELHSTFVWIAINGSVHYLHYETSSLSVIRHAHLFISTRFSGQQAPNYKHCRNSRPKHI